MDDERLCIRWMDSRNHPSTAAVRHTTGVMFSMIIALANIPFCSIGLFLYERQFFLRENATDLYPCSAYYLAYTILETLLNAFNGALFGLINFYIVRIVILGLVVTLICAYIFACLYDASTDAPSDELDVVLSSLTATQWCIRKSYGLWQGLSGSLHS